ncbi:MAG: 16S rRNA (guanine(527)-N(7))-methyltransferase RsmG [Acidobacteria bacterium]|nr:16S rRNA (guanine(527)-N(7))-methyltransferase RsmG [Acidobacteriota bacterium]
MSFLPLELLESGAAELGVALTADQLDQFDRFASFLVETNRSFNLTRITDPADIVTAHYLDSLSSLSALALRPGERVIDVGTGAGLPGIAIAIVCKDVSVTLLDSSQKKARFLSEAAERLGLTNAKTLPLRAEDAGRDPAEREQYDAAFARALARMSVLVELCLPLVTPGGHLVAQKSTGAQVQEEIAEAKPLIERLGGQISDVLEVKIPSTSITRSLVVVSKVKPTPASFPRPYAQIIR